MTSITIPEPARADELGLHHKILRELRKKNAADLPQGEAWKKDGPAIVWTQEGRDALLRVLELEKNAAPPPAPAQPPALVPLVVVRICQNPRIVLVRRPGEDMTLLRLQVRESKNFAPGMLVEKCRPTATPDLFHLEGRCPRFRGRW